MVGAGPAGLACAVTAAERGHRVTLYEADARIGGQLNLARNVPGKEEFDETLRYYRTRIERLGIDLHLGQRPSAEALAAHGFDEVVIATGVTPRLPDIPGIDHASCASYVDILNGKRTAGRRVAIMGAGGIGFDVAEFLTSAAPGAGGEPRALPRRVGRGRQYRQPRRARAGVRVPSPLGGGTGGGDGRTSDSRDSPHP